MVGAVAPNVKAPSSIIVAAKIYLFLFACAFALSRASDLRLQ